MSQEHAQRLKSTWREWEAASEALDKAWRFGSSNPRYYLTDVQDIRHAYQNAEKTYYIRLVAETEAMLFRHLKDHWPAFEFDESVGGTGLLDRCRNHVNPTWNVPLPDDLANDVLSAIRWRNHLAHGEKGVPPPRVTYLEAFGFLYDLLLILPKMKGPHA